MLTDIENVQQFIEAAQKEGFQVNESEAETVLGYMEGHYYTLGLDGYGAVFRGDLAYEEGRVHWEPYSIRDAILFAGEMCADLVGGGDNSDKQQAQYEEDEKILGPLYEAALNWRG